jgi:monooxygenase
MSPLTSAESVRDVDVLIIGAGLSGVGAACHLQRECPEKTVAILEARDTIGGTWDLFRYPGVRSDSDMFTLGYSFRPWASPQAIADGPAILQYVRETAQEYGVDRRIHFGHRATRAEWSSETARWTVTATRSGAGGMEDTVIFTCAFLSVCSGYYRYDHGFTPAFAGADEFAGQVVHPQHWPEGLDYTDKRVVVIGSGATAVTLVPTMAERLQGRLPERLAHSLVRWKNVLTGIGVFQLSRRRPETMKRLLRRSAVAKLPVGFDVDTHLAPTYNPWDQRLCAAPDGDVFRAIRSGRADIVTERIERFTLGGVRLASGRELPADIIVTATGLDLLFLGGLSLTVDDQEVSPADTLAYKGMMLSGVPNFSLTLGYTNASWTLKADLVGRYVSRLLKYLDAHGYQSVTPVAPDLGDRDALVPLIDLQSGYVRRASAVLPKQGPNAPWRLHQNYLRDLWLMRARPVTDGVRFGRATGGSRASLRRAQGSSGQATGGAAR